ncbi:hypothetical protein CWI37_0518p0030 [Hamiltosporidium tvaerminnensis]|uniref:Uncharacterized protein n=1 Tax=Hamiltosporidium tvaerminnensis TaxID=1176355 RepID=A0A4V2JV16_9MICR|nr:hypothetical protein CWI37_0518p0030 [Hamiltosporidium tvaerminnensis]
MGTKNLKENIKTDKEPELTVKISNNIELDDLYRNTGWITKIISTRPRCPSHLEQIPEVRTVKRVYLCNSEGRRLPVTAKLDD